MELKRILARDTRSATEQAIALYGPDVLVISNHQVGGQTELVVALDVPAKEAAKPMAASPTPAPAAEAAPAGETFRSSLLQAQQAPAAARRAAEAEMPAVPSVPAAIALAPASAAPVRSPEDAQELQRSREIVDMVREEIAALRREFRLSQQTSAWQGGLQLHPQLMPLAESLNEMNVPTALRALLIDALQGLECPKQAVDTWRKQLEHDLQRPQAPLPTQGVHVLAGPSGAGKTLMSARLASHGSQLHGAEGVALISYRDQRAGAWSQSQMLSAQLGVDCFRAQDEESLRLLLSELSARALVLIDTPGVQMSERLAEICQLAPQAACHAVVPADASSATLRKLLVDAQVPWHSLMLSKVDEANAPWPLVQLLSHNQLPFSTASNGNRMTDLIHAFHIPQLVDLALVPMADPHIPDLSVKASAATATRSARKSAPARARARPAA
jgi:flagellar biosynthesis protein FlhF